MKVDKQTLRTIRHRPTTATGFTLLEAIVAVAIIGFALIPLVSFLSLSANELAKAAESNERSFVTQAVIAMMDPVNPVEEPSGSMPLNDKVLISWDSQQLIPPGKQIMPNSGLPGFRLSFYKVHVTVSRPISGDWFNFDMRKVGYDAIPFDASTPAP
ncbi:MAG: hypothetical protein EPO08_15195 [Rhodospirillaceae bacterium]|nr:MAG: hypothetical protein EPO08_15195 [Rhodospirillaceae bacterium]